MVGYKFNNCGAFNPGTDYYGVVLVDDTVIVGLYLILCTRDYLVSVWNIL